jgi:hypothetical protein
MTDRMWFAAGVASLVAVLIFASLVSRLFGEPASHRAGIDEDEDDPEPVLRIDPSLYPRGYNPPGFQDGNLGPPPTYPETPEEHTP